MSKLHEISCRNCGTSISLDQEWDRTPSDFRPQDRVLRRCLMCGGEMQFFKRWIDPPTTHPECSEQRWSEAPCAMCFGPMTVSGEPGTVRRYHDRCRPEFWYERSCDICQEPMRLHVDWEDPPSRHRGCETDEWYEKGCKYCGTTLKVHVSWNHPPAAHPECGPLEVVESHFIDADAEFVSEDRESVTATRLAQADNTADDPYAETRSESLDFDDAIKYHDDIQEKTASEELTNDSSADDAEISSEIFEENYVTSEDAVAFTENDNSAEPEGLPSEDDEQVLLNGHDLETADAAADLYEFAETPGSDVDESEVAFDEDAVDAPVAPGFLYAAVDATEPVDTAGVEESSFAQADNADDEQLASMADDAAPDDSAIEPVADECPTCIEAEANDTTSEHGRFCTRCGKRLASIDAFHLSKNGSASDAEGICRDCEHDLMLVGGAVAALRKATPFDLRSVSELRTVTFPVTVVTNAETGELVAEVMLMDDGVFSQDRVAVAYDPTTEERLSKTVFGHKGLFSSLRTAETYDREGNLLHHARHGGELALAADADGVGEHPVQVERNRFFFRKR